LVMAVKGEALTPSSADDPARSERTQGLF
jgi:hypothetical protein